VSGLDKAFGPGAVVDVSKHMDDWAVIIPAMLEAAPFVACPQRD
jgi:hypothetical protein